MNYTTEGCFCPDGTKLFNKESDVCVSKCGKADIFNSVAEIISQHPSWIFFKTAYVLAGCLDPEGIPREVRRFFHILLKHWLLLGSGSDPCCGLWCQFNEKFEYKCQDCICEESTKTVKCKPKTCPPPPLANCTGPGFVLVNQTNPADNCCPIFKCRKIWSNSLNVPFRLI